MKKFVSFFILFVIVFTMSACSQKSDNEITDGTSTTTTTASTTKAETTETTANKETKPDAENMPATKKPSTTQASKSNTDTKTATKKQEATTKVKTSSKSQSTTKKQTTTKKAETTTKKSTTCTNNDNHSIMCGNMGKWFNSRSEVDKYWKEVINVWYEKYVNGEISWEERSKKTPDGYECWTCSYCGKWTGNFYY